MPAGADDVVDPDRGQVARGVVHPGADRGIDREVADLGERLSRARRRDGPRAPSAQLCHRPSPWGAQRAPCGGSARSSATPSSLAGQGALRGPRAAPPPAIIFAWCSWFEHAATTRHRGPAGAAPSPRRVGCGVPAGAAAALREPHRRQRDRLREPRPARSPAWKRRPPRPRRVHVAGSIAGPGRPLAIDMELAPGPGRQGHDPRGGPARRTSSRSPGGCT